MDQLSALELATKDVLTWAVFSFDNLCVAASFGKDSTVLLHMLREIKPDIDVVYLNTGYEFRETLVFIEELRARWHLNIIEYRPRLTIEEQEERYGKELYKTNPEKCCGIRKVEPMERALRNYNAWITGLRRDETEFRKNIQVIERQNGIVKINPLANWTEDDVWEYIRVHDVPYNPLYDQGYRSLGCWPCTLAGQWGRFERAGRWNGTLKQGGECGIHLSFDADTIHGFLNEEDSGIR